jgi:hypothetical protein
MQLPRPLLTESCFGPGFDYDECKSLFFGQARRGATGRAQTVPPGAPGDTGRGVVRILTRPREGYLAPLRGFERSVGQSAAEWTGALTAAFPG